MSILSVVVICNRKVEKAQTVISLVKAFRNNPAAFKTFELVIYDNSLDSQVLPLGIPFPCEYKHDPKNGGLAAAYNYALQRAVAEGYDWLLLFDDDTSVPVDFIEKFDSISSKVPDNVAAIVPKVYYKGRYFSPYKVLFGDIHRPVDENSTGICDYEISAVGSGTMLRTSFMQNIGGFNETFWLDCQDSWIFHFIYLKGRKVYIASVKIEHELSIFDYDKFMSAERYLNTLKYEALFIRSYKTKLENLFYPIRLIKRTITQFFTIRNKKYSLMTLRHLLSWIFSPDKCCEVLKKSPSVLKQ